MVALLAMLPHWQNQSAKAPKFTYELSKLLKPQETLLNETQLNTLKGKL
jgi:hypothetical protein